MGLFTPHKKKPNAFNYTPRFYDPRKEALEQRRKELRGESSETDAAEYTPGLYLRTQREARAERRSGRADRRTRNSGIITVTAVALLAVFVYMLYPRIAEFFIASHEKAPRIEQAEEEFDPYAPITIVPNDYKE